MEIIKKIIPKNPIDSATMKQIGDRVQNLLKVFGKNYALQTTIVIVNNKEREYEEEQIRKAKLEKYMNYKKRYYKKKIWRRSNHTRNSSSSTKRCYFRGNDRLLQ